MHTQNQVVFRFGDTTFISRLIEGRFPNYEQVIPKEQKTTAQINRAELLSALKRVSLLTSQDNQSAKIDFISYPQIRIFAEYLIDQDEIDHQGLFSELKQFESNLQEKLFMAADEKALLEIIGFVGLLEQYFRLEMSREKLVLYLQNSDKIKPSWI